MSGIPLDKAELLSAVLEGILYGFSLLMFGGVIWALLSQRSTYQVNLRMVVVASALLLLSTVHMIIDIIRVVEGLILFRDTYPGGPIGYFSEVSQWTFVSKNYVYTAQTLIGDGVILYRCYVAWQSKLIMIFPVLLWCSVGVCGIGSAYTASQVSQFESFGGNISRWITSFYVSTLTTNFLATTILAYRLWSVDRWAMNLSGRKSQLRPALHVIVDAGVIYSVTLLAALITYLKESNGQYVILDMVTPIVSVTFYMVIIRIGMTNWANRTTDLFSFGRPSVDPMPLDRTRMQVRIRTLTERGPRSSLMNNEHRLGEAKIDEVDETV